ncbi:hypothetical protein, partial [Roseinatronobacter sp.]|uniref:hypothetical protein n=1 Tax=Roseinatronobacter sp. TaxID=1945755 RepID=UPI0025DC37E3
DQPRQKGRISHDRCNRNPARTILCLSGGQFPRGGDGALPAVLVAADLLAAEHEPQDQYRDPEQFHAVAA